MLQEKRVYWGRKDIYSGDFKKRMSKKDIWQIAFLFPSFFRFVQFFNVFLLIFHFDRKYCGKNSVRNNALNIINKLLKVFKVLRKKNL